jgi:Sigma-70, region 4
MKTAAFFKRRTPSQTIKVSRDGTRPESLPLGPNPVADQSAIADEDTDTGTNRPRTRGECKDMVRPCPYVLCKYHLYLDVDDRNGDLKINFPDRALEQMIDTCTLDVADRSDGITLQEVATRMNLTRERVRQIERSGLRKMRRAGFGIEHLS